MNPMREILINVMKMKVKEDDIVKAAEMSLGDGAILNNPRLVLEASEMLEIYRKVL